MNLNFSPSIESLKEVTLDELDQNRFYIFCDGSGSNWNNPFGYFSIIYDSKAKISKNVRGGGSFGTNNYAEILPVIHSLFKCKHIISKEPKDKNINFKHKVKIFSDSLLTVNTINGIYAVGENNPELWSCLFDFEDTFDIMASYVDDSSNLMADIDCCSKEIRKSYE